MNTPEAASSRSSDREGGAEEQHLGAPLAGIKVLAIEQYGAAPFGSMLLADLGADVIKIENPSDGGDMSRSLGPHFFGKGDSHFYQALNRNKRSLTLNLKKPEGRAIFRELVRGADAVFDNLRGDGPAELGLTFGQLKEANPRIVCAHLSAFGREGPRRSWPGYDYLMQAEAGYLTLTGDPDGLPERCGVSIIDFMAGVMAAFALVSAVVGARNKAVGGDVDVNLFDTALHNLTYLAAWYLNAGQITTRQKRSAHPSLTPSQLYRTADDWIFVMCNKEKFWPMLAEKLGKPDLAKDRRFSTFDDRLRNREALGKILDDAFMTKTTKEWMDALGGAIPAAPVYDVARALDNPFVRDGDRIAAFERREGGQPVEMLTSPILIDGKRPRTTAAPPIGYDTNSILAELGVSDARIDALRGSGVV